MSSLPTQSAPAVSASNPNKFVDTKPFTFSFRKDKLGNQRPKIEVDAAVPSFEGIVSILENAEKNPKAFVLLQDAMYDVIRAQGISLVSDDPNITKENFPLDKMTWQAIAEIEKEDRRSSAIPDSQWEVFATDYAKVMMATGKTESQVSNAIIVYKAKFVPIKSNKPILQKMKSQLSVYMDNTEQGEELNDIIQLLTRRLDNYLKADDVQELINNL